MSEPANAAAYRCGARLDAAAFAQLRRTLVLEHCKWDPQVGDVATIADFPLLMPHRTWQRLASWAEACTAEAVVAERELAARPELYRQLGLPRALRKVLAPRQREALERRAPRVFRYDFHLTRGGWQISECNADVPGGYAEASAYPALMAAHYPGTVAAGDPGRAWAEAIATVAESAEIALLSAPGFMEDHQVIRYLGKRLRELGLRPHCLQPAHVDWQRGVGFWGKLRLGAVLRFYQAEWLAKLPAAARAGLYFRGGSTPVLNPGTCITIESKRFPLVWDTLRSTPLGAWRRLLPRCADPREVAWQTDDSWLLKTALCNTGDTVSVRGLLPPARWAKAARSARWFPGQGVAQRRFEPEALHTPMGAVFPCIGVYTVDGRAAGAYARLSRGPIVDFAAVDAPLLLEEPRHAPLS